MDVLNVFGEVSEEIANTQKYAKWKATYIHTCLKNGITPVPGPPTTENEQTEIHFPGQSNDVQPTNNFTPATPPPDGCLKNILNIYHNYQV